jgi:hypothetical protein
MIAFLLVLLSLASGGEGSAQAALGAEADRFPSLQVMEAGPGPLEGRVRIHFAPGGEVRAGRTLALLEAHARLPGIPEGIPSRAEIILAPDQATWDQVTGGQVPHWGAGVAIPSLGRIVIPLFRNPWSGSGSEDRTLLHEWAHLGLHESLEGLRIPRWFDEGYAQWASGGWDRESMWKLRLALARGDAPPLTALTLEWPRDRVDAELAYGLSASAVAFLVESSGPVGMERLLERWRETGDFEPAFRTTFGWTPGQFELRWVEHVRRRYGWILFLSETVFIWGTLAVGLLLLFGVRRRRDRARLEQLRGAEAEEPSPSGWWTPLGGAKAPPPTDAGRPPVDPPSAGG